MRIAFVNQPIDAILPPYQSSVGACTYGAARSLAKLRECQVSVYGTLDRNRDDDGDDFVRDGVRFRFLPSTLGDRMLSRARELASKILPSVPPASSSALHFPAFGAAVAELLRDDRCDVIHVQHASQYVPIIRQLNPDARIVLHLHAEWYSQNRGPSLERRLRQCDLVTTVSNFVTARTAAGFPAIADICATTYNGIEPAEFAIPHDYSRKPHPKRILYAGAVSPHKGVHNLLDAFKLIARRIPSVHLDIVGFQGSYGLEETFDVADRRGRALVTPFYRRHYADRLKARLGMGPRDAGTYMAYLKSQLTPDIAEKVSFVGFTPRESLLEHYRSADVFVFPPVWDEGFGIPPVEAMAAGTPVVATRSGAVPETVVDGETGFIVNKNEPRALADAILAILENPPLAERLGRAGRQRATTQFSWDGVAATMYQRYANLRQNSVLPATRTTTATQICEG